MAASLAVSMLLGQASILGVNAASTTVQKSTVVHTVNNLAAVKLSSTTTAKLSSVNILSQDGQNTLTYTLTYQNNGNTVISLNDYWTKVKTKSGTVYTVSPISADKDKDKVLPGASVSVTYMSKIPKNLQFYDLYFQLIKWDFSQPNYERSLGSINVPSTYTIATPLNYSQKLAMNDSTAKIKISSASAVTSGNYNYLSVALNVENVGNTLLTNPGWKYVIQTVSGTTFNLTPDASSTSYDIQSQDNKTLNLIAKIPNQVSLKNLKLLVVQTDETSKSDYAVTMLKMNNTDPSSSVIGVNKTKTFTIADGAISTKVDSASTSQGNDQTNLSLQFIVKNTGNRKITVPEYTFEIQSGGAYYPVSTDSLTDLSLDPNESIIASLDATVPTINARKGMKLVLLAPTATQASNDQSSTETVMTSYPVAVYSIPEEAGQQNTLGSEQQIKNNYGNFGITLDSVQRVPWADGTLLTSKITIRNNGSTSAQLPTFSGLYKIDSTPLNVDTQLVDTNTTKVLPAGSQTNVYIVTKVPGDLDFNQLQIQLLQKISDNKTSSWVQFTKLGSLSAPKEVTSGSTADMNTSGKNVTLAEHKTYVYKGISSNVLYSEMIMQNVEASQTNLSQLVAYFESEDGQYYQADVKQIDHAAGPKSSSIVTFSAKVPKSLSTTGLKLIVGEGTKDSALTSIGEDSTGYVNAAVMDLTVDNREAQRSLENISLFPYTLNINSFTGYTSGSGLQIDLNYDLARDLNYDMGQFGHKFVLEVTDSSGLRFDKEIELEKDFTVGTNQTYTYTITDPIYETVRTGNFQFTIYDEFDGEKTPIATQAEYYSDSQF